MVENSRPKFSHRHWCEVYGHYYECQREECHCICGGSMQGTWDHSKCPVELRPCPEHVAEQIRRIEEAKSAASEAEVKRLWQEWDAADKVGSPDSEAKLDALMRYIFGENTDDPAGK